MSFDDAEEESGAHSDDLDGVAAAPPAGGEAPEKKVVTVPSKIFLLGYGIVISLVAVGIAAVFIKSQTGLWGALLTAFGLTRIIIRLFARHRTATWAAGGDTTVAIFEARELVENILALLLGIIFSFAFFALVLSPETRASLFPAQFDALLGGGTLLSLAGETFFNSAILSNILLCLAVFVLTALFKELGMAVAVAWIGSLWGVGLVVYITNQGNTISTAGVIVALLSLASVSTALTIAGAAGLFLSRGLFKYGASSDKFLNIRKTSARLLSYSALFIFIAAALTMLTQSMILVRTIRSLI